MKKTALILFALMMLFVCPAALAEEAQQPSPILIAYFTWADNTVVEDEEASLQSALQHYSNMGDSASGVDASSSASLIVPGNTAIMAGFIRDSVDGDLFSIQVEELYPSNYEECLDRAADELDEEARPALKPMCRIWSNTTPCFWDFPIGGIPAPWPSRALWRSMTSPAKRSFPLWRMARAAFPGLCGI